MNSHEIWREMEFHMGMRQLSIASLSSMSSDLSKDSDSSKGSSESDHPIVVPRRWWIVFEFKESDRQLTDYEIIQKMLTNIKEREDVFVTDFDSTGWIPFSYIFDIVTMTDTDDDILEEASIVVENWLTDFAGNGPPFQREKIFGSD